MKWQPKKLTRRQMAERRKEGVKLLKAGEKSQAEIARHLGVTEAAVSKWKKKLREEAVMPLEKAFIIKALERCDWNVTKAADDVGMLRPNFQALLKRHNISTRKREP